MLNYQNISILRTKAKLTQRDLAAKANLSSSYIALLEIGKKINPSIDVLEKISTALEMPLDALIRVLMEPLDDR